MRLIDADKLVGGIAMAFCVPCVEQGNNHDEVRCRVCQYRDMIEIIECSPTIDAEPVIRCKNCIHWNKINGCCSIFHSFRDDESYCDVGITIHAGSHSNAIS